MYVMVLGGYVPGGGSSVNTAYGVARLRSIPRKIRRLAKPAQHMKQRATGNGTEHLWLIMKIRLSTTRYNLYSTESHSE